MSVNCCNGDNRTEEEPLCFLKFSCEIQYCWSSRWEIKFITFSEADYTDFVFIPHKLWNHWPPLPVPVPALCDANWPLTSHLESQSYVIECHISTSQMWLLTLESITQGPSEVNRRSYPELKNCPPLNSSSTFTQRDWFHLAETDTCICCFMLFRWILTSV